MKKLENISSIKELSRQELLLITGGEYPALNWLVDKIGFGVGYVGEKLRQGIEAYGKNKGHSVGPGIPL